MSSFAKITSVMHTGFFVVDLIFFPPIAALYAIGRNGGCKEDLKVSYNNSNINI